MSAHDAAARPARFGRYEVVRLLGSGGFGRVFLCRDPTLGREVAVKVPRGDVRWDDGVLAEARALARLAHPAIVSVLDAGEDVGQPFVVLELVRGSDLAALSSAAGGTRRRWSPAVALDLLRGPAAGIDHAHSHGVLHLDIKPGNLLVEAAHDPLLLPEIDEGTVKVADFGLHALSARGATSVTAPAAGDPRYVAPEAWRGAPDSGSDVFALAAVFFDLACGRPPLPGRTPAELLVNAGRGERLRLADLRPELPRALDLALAAALSPRRHERPASAAGLVAALDEALRRDADEQALLTAARDRIARREPPRSRRCAACGRPLSPRADGCPRCDA